MRQSMRPGTILLCLALGTILGMPAFSASIKNIMNLANASTSSLALTYSPDGLATVSGTVIVNNGTQAANNAPFCVVFTLTNPGAQGGLSFSLVNQANGDTLSLSGSPASSTQVLSGTFAQGTRANTNQTFTVSFQVNPTNLPAPGSYVATIREDLYSGSTYPPAGSVLDTNTLTVTVTVGSHYDVSVVPTGSTFALATTSQALSFGNLSAGQALGADILVRSNVSYSLALSSANLGSLTNLVDPASAIAYGLKSNGSSLSLNPGPAYLAQAAAATFSVPLRYSLLVTIQPLPDNPSAGTYTDTLTVILTAP